MIKKILYFLSKQSAVLDQKNILSLLEFNPSARLLDLGAGNGLWTKIIAKKIGTKNITGVDVIARSKATKQSRPGSPRPYGLAMTFVKSDLNKKFPFPDNYFDIISANQIIEHIENTDNFISEIKRALKPNGYAIISTENLSGWHNIFALLLGWQPSKHGFKIEKILPAGYFKLQTLIDPLHCHRITLKIRDNSYLAASPSIYP